MNKKVASEVDAEVDANELASIVTVSAVAASGKSHAGARTRARRRARRRFRNRVRPLRSSTGRARRLLLGLKSELQLLNGPGGESGRAGLLQRFNHYLGDPGYLKKWVDRINAVTAEDVRRVARQQLSPAQRAWWS